MRICQFASVCLQYCTHRWAHEPDNSSGGCKQQGCDNPYITSGTGLIDEFDKKLRPGLCNPGYCVDFKYWVDHTKHGQLVTSKGTVMEDIMEREVAHKVKERERWDREREMDRARWQAEEQASRQREIEALNTAEARILEREEGEDGTG